MRLWCTRSSAGFCVDAGIHTPHQFSATNPLWIARYNTTPGTLPAGWAYYTFWQYTDSPVDQDYFNGDLTRLRALALG